MACCSGTSQVKKFNATLYWRAQPDAERRLLFTATGENGVWVGEGSASYELGTPPWSCGSRDLRGTVVMRSKLTLKCAEAGELVLIKGTLQLAWGKSRFQVRLRQQALSCAAAIAADWNLLFLRELGVGRLVLTSSQ